MDLPELVARDQDDMVRIAKHIATEPSHRGQLRSKVAANRLTAPLFDTVRFTRDFETAVAMVVQRHRAGLPPAHLDVPDHGPLQSGAAEAGFDGRVDAVQRAYAGSPLPLEKICLKVISLQRRADRRQECLGELSKLGMSPNPEFFFDAKSVPEFGALGCALSHAKVLADFLFCDERPFALILEDDFSIRDAGAFVSTVDRFCSQDILWDVILLGHNSAIPIEPTHFGTACRAINSQTTSGYLVGRFYAIKLLECFFRSAESLRRYQYLPDPNRTIAKSLFSCDILWKELQTRDRFVVPIPSLIIQRPSYSDVEKRDVAYGV